MEEVKILSSCVGERGPRHACVRAGGRMGVLQLAKGLGGHSAASEDA